jgi:hypothetical protein
MSVRLTSAQWLIIQGRLFAKLFATGDDDALSLLRGRKPVEQQEQPGAWRAL